MSDSLKDQLLGLGFKPTPSAPVAPRRDQPARGGHSSHGSRREQRGKPDARAEHGARAEHTPQRKPSPTREEFDLAKAYALRSRQEKDERIEAERQKQEAARIKREAKTKVAELLKDKSLVAPDAEQARHFEYNGKIRRVHVTETQLKALNAGELGVVQLDGRYLIVDAAIAREVHALLPSLLALLVDPNAPVTDDPYADPKFAVPDDMVW